MGSVASPAEAVARIAYLASDVVLSVQPSLSTESEFSYHFSRFKANGSKNFVSKTLPEIIPVRQNADPLLSAYTPLRAGKLVSVTTSSSILLNSVPHLYKLAQYPVVLHVALATPHADFSEISSIRQSGFTFLQSETLQEAQDIALSAHALAVRSGKGVIHFWDPSNSLGDNPIAAESREVIQALLENGAGVKASHSGEVEQTLYTSSGRTATVTDLGLPAVAAQDSAPISSEALSPVTAPVSSTNGHTEISSAASTSSRRDSSSGATDPSSVATSVETPIARAINATDIFTYVSEIWAAISHITGRSYSAIEYSGPPDAEAALFVFGSTGVFVDVLDADDVPVELTNLGIITARLYRPWLGSAVLLDSIPKTITKIAVLEQIKRKTTKWGPSFLDLLSSLSPSGGKSPISLVQYRLGHIDASTALQALKGIFQNLAPPSTPRKHSRRRGRSQTALLSIQNLTIGNEVEPVIDNFTLEQPELENAYLKILDQLFSNRLYIANRLSEKNAGVSATVAASPEYGFGSLLARTERRQQFIREAEEAARSNQFITEAPKQWLSRWVLNANDTSKANEYAPEVIARLSNDGTRLAGSLLDKKAFFFKEAQWLIGSDAWAYDLGNSGVHHVLASGANVNMLIIDSEPYSERTAADSMRRKKDIGLYAMNFGNAYVASVAVYSSYTQVLQAFIEAEKFNGPSIVLAYLPYQKESDSPLSVLQDTKKAVDMGYWPLYRWDPSNEGNGEPTFSLDSERIKRELEEFLRRDNQLTQVMNRHPQFAASLSESYGSEVRKLQKRKAKDAYEQMLEGLYGAPLTILFASDNGNAENLAKRLGNRGKARGLKTMVFAMDDYPLEDLPNEENVVFITSTAGQGEFPQNGHAFWKAIKDSTDLDLSNTHYSVFALGDSHYWPRKEDKIFYNKPGKDLDAQLKFLGGKELTAIGLGDDQDPDGFQTGYQEWEPRLWQALNVANVEGLPEEPPPLTNEDIKIASNYLRGTIAEGLEDTSTGAISASDQQLTKFHGTYMQDDRDLRDERKAQGLEPAYSFMIRCRLPGGVATPSQWQQMDAIASAHGNETMKLTTRQTFQFHGVIKSKLRPAMRAINKALMTTIAACGDVNRNVMCSSLPTMSEYHHEVHAVSKRISDHLLPSTTAYHEIWLKDSTTGEKTQVAGDAVQDFEPLYGPTYLPRKFKISIAIPPHNDTDVYAHDIGLIAIRTKDNKHLEGFNVLAGGGMGVTHNNKKTYPRLGYMMGYVPADKVHLACEKIMLVQRDHGDRKNRKHARLKYTMDDMGNEVFKAKVQDLLDPLKIKFEAPRPFKFDSNIDTFGWTKDEHGLNHFTFFIENGRVEDTAEFPMRTGLREIAKIHQGEFRLTGNQHLTLSNVTDEAKPQIAELMKKYKLDNTQFSGLRLSSSACVAFPTCGLAMAESERYLPELITKLESCLEENGLAQDSIVMRMTGCPNGCARPWVAEAAFVGKAYGAYNMYLGGGYHGQRLNKLYRSSIKEDEILEIMRGLLARYSKERNAGERFGDWTIRAGVINETTEGKNFHENTAEEESDGE
ncbi:sulfite reductase (NADPH) hemoprotein, beta-component [Cladophialophora carrionii CBS 160.54]|uniref:Sulfite reductase [NADPH] subunit beta n=1 Tax=Cladophialophora carrionii CBS 160.54 TaxID=1279043 RepID=V9D415_9EURO|nr:sulfite reductase (NADPH) hemoprotein, beta-component [Cladophialophora carrionii CBS 160.54]ETI20747.1 sulfite reductase (NADPH) hemoprotein, beta-component [Cladophialophora carrionii CBS 160.54]